ncbi:MAG: SDR family oxidoreductase [Pseudoclavibacter sp.]|nr:SDR family oxidoreductase [Pseudoclavibacter sp.]
MRTTRPLALVTGGSRGIGRAICRALGPSHRVLVGATAAAGARRVAEALPDADVFVADLVDERAVARACAGIDRLDLLVHSAGVAVSGDVADTPRAEWERVLALNVTAVADLSRRLLPALRAAEGLVVTINSGAGLVAGPGSAAYSASKFALRAFSDALRAEERGRVRVCSIHPGRVDTDMQRELWERAGAAEYRGSQHLSPDAVAAAVLAVVQAGPEAAVEQLSIRPPVQHDP